MDPVKDKTETKEIDFHERCVFAYALIMNARNTLHHAQTVLYSQREKMYGTDVSLCLTRAHDEVYALEMKMARFIWPCPTTWPPKGESK